MASTHTSLDAAATERKARLAKLASLKRKQPPTEQEESNSESLRSTNESTQTSDLKPLHLSLRNYDPETRGPKLGFEAPPIQPDQETLETRAAQVAAETKAQEGKEKDKADTKGIDLFDLQPRKLNWDLKRDLAKKLAPLQQKTDNAIARMVRERLEGQKNKQRPQHGSQVNGSQDGISTGSHGDGEDGQEDEDVGMGGVDLVEGIHVREREEEAERRLAEQDEDLG